MLPITELAEFRSRVAAKPEIRELDLGDGVISFCYVVAGESTFDDAWAREARGICFDAATGRVCARPLHKFFNVNEREATQAHRLPWGQVVRAMEKRDGSLIHTVATRAGLRLKSKKAFTSAVAVAATAWLNSPAGAATRRLCEEVLARDATACFEWTAPDARIVVPYPSPELQLLHVRANVTGAYWPVEELRELCARHGARLVAPAPFAAELESGQLADPGKQLLQLAATTTGVEGWVLQFADGELVKLKTNWYLERHKAMTFLRERDIAKLVLAEQLDDLKALLASEGVDLAPVLAIEQRVLADVRALEREVAEAHAAEQHLDRKSFALRYRDHPYFGLLMERYTGREPNVKKFFEQRLLKERYGLNQLSLLQTAADLDE